MSAEDDYLASCLAVTMTKLAVKSKRKLSLTYKTISVDSIMIMCAMLKERQSKTGGENGKRAIRKMDHDCVSRI